MHFPVIIGFANGNLSSVFDDHGGQCEDGLKMILDIGQPKRDTQDNDKPDVPGEEKPPDQEKPILGSLGGMLTTNYVYIAIQYHQLLLHRGPGRV